MSHRNFGANIELPYRTKLAMESLGLPRFITHLCSGYRFRVTEGITGNKTNNRKLFSCAFLSRNASGPAEEMHVELRAFDGQLVAFLQSPAFTGTANCQAPLSPNFENISLSNSVRLDKIHGNKAYHSGRTV
jgi:hypothetical protein